MSDLYSQYQTTYLIGDFRAHVQRQYSTQAISDDQWISWSRIQSIQWPFQELIYWRYLPYKRPMF